MATHPSSGKGPADGEPSPLSTLPKILPASFLKEITNNFTADRELGKGAFGTVFKGILPHGEVIAVKQLGANSAVSYERQFENEAVNLMAAQHENIVKLVHYCHEKQKKVVEHDRKYVIMDVPETFLCYEYLSNGNLDNYLFGSSYTISWPKRFNIIKGICQGLHFLHNGMDRPVVHMDLKPENILLDNNMIPKIADFGLSRLFGQEQTRMNTQTVVGACGYLAPEYLYRGEISTQSDIYSLGMLLIQISTGEKNKSNAEDKCGAKFVEKVRQEWTDHKIASMYASLHAGHLQEIKRCIEIGLQCVDVDRKKRPSITEIIGKLSGIR